jgi:hypothetical protein
MLPLVLLGVAAVPGDPASSGLQGLFVVGLPHTFAGYSSARTLHGQSRPPTTPLSSTAKKKAGPMAQPSLMPSCRHERFQHNGLLPPFASHSHRGEGAKRSWLCAPDGCYLSGGSFNRAPP